MKRAKFLFVPIGKAIEPWIIEKLKQRLEEMPLEVICSSPISYPLVAFNPVEKKLFTPLLLEILKHQSPEGDFILGLTDLDLYSLTENSLSLEVHPRFHTAVISLQPLQEFLFDFLSEKVFFQRLYKEVLRAWGGMLGLGPCSNPKCVMHPSRTPLEIDFKENIFCNECLFKLRLRINSIPFFRKAA